MTVTERTRTIHKHLFQYSAYKLAVEDYTERAFRKNGRMSASGVRGPYVSDPTARGAVMLVQLPERIANKAEWCAAIEDALAKCCIEDGGEPFGLAYILEEYFRLMKPPRPRDKNSAAVDEICAACGITSRSTFFNRIGKITDIVLYHAAKRKLI